MLIIETPPLLRRQIVRWQLENRRIALVPLRNTIHEGHLQLVRQARNCADVVIVSLSPDPTEHSSTNEPVVFQPQADYEKLASLSIELLFTPSFTTLYPHNMTQQSRVQVPSLPELPGGYATPYDLTLFSTTFSKLINLIQPDLVCLGEKNYPQLLLVRKLVEDLNYPLAIISIPIMREQDGLAYDRVNAQLSPESRQLAPALHHVISWLAQQLSLGERQFAPLLEQAAQRLCETGLQPDGLSIRDADTLEEVTVDSQRAVVLLAARLQQLQLTDNILVSLLD